MSEIEFHKPEFNPETDVKFRGKFISELSPDELRQALIQALRQIHYTQQETKT